MIVSSKSVSVLVEALKSGEVAVVKTDTLYGIVARADSQAAVTKVYQLKKRDPSKAMIVLIADTKQLYDQPELDLSDKWPGTNSIVLDSPSAPDWLKNPDGTVAYRLPDDVALCQLVLETGPLVAPSANPEGQAPAKDITEAEVYFGDNVTVYVDEGEVLADQLPSKLWRLDGTEWERLR